MTLIVSITPGQEGVLTFDGVRLSHGSGLRQRTERLGVRLCVVSVDDPGAFPRGIERCPE